MDVATLAERINEVLYVVVAAAALSGLAVVLSGWVLLLRQRDRADDATWRAMVQSRLLPEQAAPARAVVSRPSPTPLLDAFGPTADRGSSASSEPADTGARHATPPIDRRRADRRKR